MCTLTTCRQPPLCKNNSAANWPLVHTSPRCITFFGKLFKAGTEFARDGSQFDRLLGDGEDFQIEVLQVRSMYTPGHTPVCMTYLVTDASAEPARQVVFVGDALFMPEYGTVRSSV